MSKSGSPVLASSSRTLVKGVRREAQFKGLRRIQDYAGGKNRSHCKVPLADRVLVQEEGPALFRVRVRMAGGRQSGALPTPLDPKVKLVEARSEMLAVQHVPRRLTPKVIANAQSRLCLYLEGSQWIRVSAENLRLSESARTLPFRHYGELAFRVKEGPTAQGTTAALTI